MFLRLVTCLKHVYIYTIIVIVSLCFLTFTSKVGVSVNQHRHEMTLHHLKHLCRVDNVPGLFFADTACGLMTSVIYLPYHYVNYLLGRQCRDGLCHVSNQYLCPGTSQKPRY